jgi:hypothetical protein
MVDTVRTVDELLTIFEDAQAAGSITAQDVRDFIVSSQFLNSQGWEFHLDGLYTPASPRTILAGVRTKVTIDAALGDFGHPNLIHADGHFWNTSSNKVIPDALNSFGLGRFAVVAQSVSASVNRFEFEVDVGAGTFPVIFQDTAVLAKGAGVDQNFNISIPLFVGPEFLANGAEMYLTPLADMEFHTHALTIVRLYQAPA